jgi:hypothetical protein
LKVGTAVFVWWSAYSDELYAAVCYAGGYVGGEGQAAGFYVSLNHFF